MLAHGDPSLPPDLVFEDDPEVFTKELYKHLITYMNCSNPDSVKNVSIAAFCRDAVLRTVLNRSLVRSLDLFRREREMSSCSIC